MSFCHPGTVCKSTESIIRLEVLIVLIFSGSIILTVAIPQNFPDSQENARLAPSLPLLTIIISAANPSGSCQKRVRCANELSVTRFFDAVGWATGRASSLKNIFSKNSQRLVEMQHHPGAARINVPLKPKPK